MDQELQAGQQEFNTFLKEAGLRQAARFRASEAIAAINCHDWADTACVAMIVNQGLGMLAAVAMTFEREMGIPSDQARDMVMQNWESIVNDIKEQEKLFNERNSTSADSAGTDTEQASGTPEGVS
jgi:hypothetical protein